MPADSDSPRAATTGEILDAALRLFRASLPATLPLAMAAVIAGQATAAYDLARGGAATAGGTTDALRWLLLGGGGLFNLLAWAAMLRRQHAIANGGSEPLGTALAASLRLLPGLTLLCVAGTLLCLAGLVLLVVPGVYLSTAMLLALPAFVLESPRSVPGAIDRALRLVRGHWWRTTAVGGMGLIAVLVFVALGLVIGIVVGGFVTGGDLSGALVVSSVVTTILSALFTPFVLALCYVQYVELARRTRE